MKTIRLLLLSATVALTTQAARAHPHIFIDTGLVLHIAADGRLEGIEVSWAYDQMYSMLLLDDMALDPEYDGVLTEEEIGQLAGFDLNWMEGFQGDLYVTDEAEPVALGAPSLRGADFVDGQVVSRHYRALTTPEPADGLVIKAYDPEFYTAYDLTGGVRIDGPCTATIAAPDDTDAYAALETRMAALPPDAENVPLVGETFADTITLACSGSGS